MPPMLPSCTMDASRPNIWHALHGLCESAWFTHNVTWRLVGFVGHGLFLAGGNPILRL